MKPAWSFLFVLALGMCFGHAGIAMSQDGDPAEIRFALASPSKKKDKEKGRTAVFATREEIQKRGADLENTVYEIFDPNAKDPLADLGLPAELKQGNKKWWIIGGSAVLVGVGVAGYFLLLVDQDVKKIYLDYTDN